MVDLARTMTDERIREMHTERQQPFVRELRDALAMHSPIILHSVSLGRDRYTNAAVWSACVGYPDGSIETLHMTEPREIAAFHPKTGRKFALTILAHALALGMVPAEAVDKVRSVRNNIYNMMVCVGSEAFRVLAENEEHAIQSLLNRGYKGEFLVSVLEGPYSRWRANDDGSINELPSEKMLEDYLAAHPEALRALSPCRRWKAHH